MRARTKIHQHGTHTTKQARARMFAHSYRCAHGHMHPFSCMRPTYLKASASFAAPGRSVATRYSYMRLLKGKMEVVAPISAPCMSIQGAHG